jgi:acyl carrier protein
LATGRQRGRRIILERGRFWMVFERIRQILSDQLDIDEEKITLESDIVDDLEADSLDVVDLVMTIEDEYGLEVPDDQIENFRTVGDVVRYIDENT